MTENKTELLPCPFCGGEADEVYADGLFAVVCQSCFIGTLEQSVPEDSHASWNRRADLVETTTEERAAALAQKFHETYERLAPEFGYKTREASAKPWEEVPDDNKRLMIAVCSEIGIGQLIQALEAIAWQNGETWSQQVATETLQSYNKFKEQSDGQ